MKKGVMFSMILVLIVAIIFSVIILQREIISSEREHLSLKQGLRDLDHSYNSIERSLHIISDVITKRAVISSLNGIIENGTFFGDSKTEENLKELILNGTLNGVESPFIKNSTLNKVIEDLENFYAQEPKKYKMNISLDEISVTCNAFHILFNTSAEINVSKAGLAQLSRKIEIFERISVTGFEDPFYLINITNGMDSRLIKKSKHIGNLSKLILTGSGGNGWCYGEAVITESIDSVSDKDKKIIVVQDASVYTDVKLNQFCGVISEGNFPANITVPRLRNSTATTKIINNSEVLLSGVKGKVWNISRFIEHVENGEYINSTKGPGFFDRLEGKNYCSYCNGEDFGLETFVNKNSLLWLGIVINQGASNIDYLYTNNTAGIYIGLDEVSTGIPAFKYFRIDDESFDRYFG